MSSIKDQSLTEFKWSAIGEVYTHGISFVLGLVIARLLMPEDDLSTAFYLNIVVGLCAYGILFVAAPYMEDFFITDTWP